MMKSFAWIFAVLSVFAMAWPSGVEAAQSGVVNAERVNVRTQPNILSEVVAQVNTGDKVQVLETIVHDNPIPGNPREWYRIGLPEGAVLWVAQDYIDSTNNTVSGSRLNVRAGPSESYTVVARLNRGDKVEPIKAVGGWISIKPPANAFAYVATSLVDLNKAEEKEQSSNPPVKTETIELQNTRATPVLIVDDPNTGETKVLQSTIEGNRPDNDDAPPVVQTTEQNPPPTPVETVIKENSQSVNRIQPEVSTDLEMIPLGKEPSLFDKVDQTPVPVVREESGLKPIDSGELAVVTSDQVRLPSEVIIAENPSDPLDALKRIVTREGIVRRSRSIQSPTYHRLEDPVTHKTMNYLYTGRLHLHTAPTRTDLKPYEGYRIRVTGQESVDARWPKIPVIEIEELKLAD